MTAPLLIGIAWMTGGLSLGELDVLVSGGAAGIVGSQVQR